MVLSRGAEEIRHRERERERESEEKSRYVCMCTHFKLFYVYVCTQSSMTCLIIEEKRNKPDP